MQGAPRKSNRRDFFWGFECIFPNILSFPPESLHNFLSPFLFMVYFPSYPIRIRICFGFNWIFFEIFLNIFWNILNFPLRISPNFVLVLAICGILFLIPFRILVFLKNLPCPIFYRRKYPNRGRISESMNPKIDPLSEGLLVVNWP